MDTRRSFIKKAALLSGAAGIMQALPESIRKALAINPLPGSTFLDAEHVVILMQENRSFDHCYGMLRGVRGFEDPRYVHQPDGNAVWMQRNAQGEAYTPFRLDIKNTKATFLGSLPHSWANQVDARNEGHHDKWLIAKPSGYEGMEKAPLTLGYYSRADIPFYYALAESFTVCDQNFCSSLTGTTPNRLYLWSGTIRPEQRAGAPAHVVNSDVNYDKEIAWKTFPERLQDNNIPWKIYQNEISLESGLTGEEDDWLGNFTDNPIEWFSQYRVRFVPGYRRYLEKMEQLLPAEIAALEKQLQALSPESKEAEKVKRQLRQKKKLEENVKDRHRWSEENFQQLSPYEQELHRRAFTINDGDPHYRELDTFTYTDKGEKREMKIPKGDILHQLRKDVQEGKLPAVSWVVGPSNFSDHPGSPWYGAWYVSEVMDILTSKPEVWQKTIFILCYDENDGYFDHVPPFVPPHPSKKNTGKVSAGIDVAVEYVTLEQDKKMRKEEDARESPIGLGYRVPLVIASPWSRGGAVCSQVFDHTSILQFLETWLSQKTGKPVREENITEWRRTVCGDLTSAFHSYEPGKTKLPDFLSKEKVYASIHQAQFQPLPGGYAALSAHQIKSVNKGEKGILPEQEKGMAIACALPYELYADVWCDDKGTMVKLRAGNELFGKRSAGSPFIIYALQQHGRQIRHYAVKAGDALEDDFPLSMFINSRYHLRIYGPDGFYREAKGSAADRHVTMELQYEKEIGSRDKLTGNVKLLISNTSSRPVLLEITDHAYGNKPLKQEVQPAGGHLITDITWPAASSYGWYDFSVRIQGQPSFERRFAGRVQTGKPGKTDPVIGRK